MILTALLQTLWMVFAATFFGTLIGLPLAVALTITRSRHPVLHRLLDAFVNITRSFPFAILLIAVIPLTRLIVGTSLGTEAAIVPLTLAVSPFIGRLFDDCFQEVDQHLIEAAIVMGSTPLQVVVKILLREALPSLIQSLTLSMITLVGYSAMAGLVGGGGLGQLAINYGYQRFNLPIMLTTVAIMIGLVQFIQSTGNFFAHSIRKKRGLL